MHVDTLSEMNLSDKITLETEEKLLADLDVVTCKTKSMPKLLNMRNRKTKIWSEPLNRFPQNIFTLRFEETVIVGRKLLSSLKQDDLIMELHCSRICASHLLGVLDSWRSDENTIMFAFHPFTNGERHAMIAAIAENPLLEIIFPFSFLNKGKERVSPSVGWSLEPERAENLGIGEENLRHYSKKLLVDSGLKSPIIFDPACSTGQFLSAMKTALPKSTTIGQDLSLEMVEYAAAFVDQIYHGDALHPAIADGSANFVFCRFLNSEVVSTSQARLRLKRLARVVAVGGFLVVFGHTPVLVTGAEITVLGLNLQACSGTDGSGNIFQCYVARREF